MLVQLKLTLDTSNEIPTTRNNTTQRGSAVTALRTQRATVATMKIDTRHDQQYKRDISLLILCQNPTRGRHKKEIEKTQHCKDLFGSHQASKQP